METASYSNNSDYQYLTNYESTAGVPILKPNFVAPNIVAQVKRQQMAKLGPAPIYASYNTLTGSYCNKPQDPSSAYQGLDCAYAPHTTPYEATSQIIPRNAFPRVTSRMMTANAKGNQPMPTWYWDN